MPKSRTEKPRKIKIGTKVAHITRDSYTTFKVKRSKVTVTGAGAYCGGLSHSLFELVCIREGPCSLAFEEDIVRGYTDCIWQH